MMCNKFFMDDGKRTFGINSYEYAYLNFALLLVFICALLYPVVAIDFGLNVKTCGNAELCPSCGVTRDIFDIFTSQHYLQLHNAHSPAILMLLIFQILLRVRITFAGESKKMSFVGMDLFLTSTNFIILFYLFNFR